jgi:signal transduction histidine kinase
MNQVRSIDELKAVLLAWLPRIGITRFAILRSCTRQGDPAAFVSPHVPGRQVAPGPDAFRVFLTMPEVAIDTKEVIVASDLALKPWFDAIEPFVVGTFPLVVGDTWYGLAFLELSRDAGVWERSVQEQVASVFHRLALESQNLDEQTRTRAKTEQLEAQDRLVSEVAHEINTPLGAILSSSGALEVGLRDIVEHSTRFFASLSPEGLQAYERLAECRPQGQSGRSRHLERLQRGTLSRLLAGLGLDNPILAEELVGIGWDGDDEELATVAGLADFEAVVHYLSSVEDLATSSRVIAVAAEKVSTFVARLVVATQTEIKNRENGESPTT